MTVDDSCISGKPEDSHDHPSDCEILERYRARSREKMEQRPTERVKLLYAKAEPILLLLLDVDGVLTDGSLVYSHNDIESKVFNTQDGLGLRLATQGGVETGIITARTSPMVRKRAEELGMKYLYQGVENKLDTFRTILDRAGCKPYQVCYMGDDLIDLGLLSRVGLAACPANAVPEVKDICHFVADRTGGSGAVRQTCELILRAKGRYQALLQQFL